MNYKLLLICAIFGVTIHTAHAMAPSTQQSKISPNGFESLAQVMRQIGDAGISEHHADFKLLWNQYDVMMKAIQKNTNPFRTAEFDARAFELAKSFNQKAAAIERARQLDEDIL